MFAGQSERNVKEGSGNGSFLSIETHLRNLGGGVHFIRDIEVQMTEGSGNGVSLCLWELCEGNLEGWVLYWEN
jgi:hypothetical protein